ncbi:translation initiation factor IF-2 [Drosophila grimshawi]|uniref:GH14424 n=1 Tax=Drosophila grimshawi TaxID=7222 RepID=B4J174_DROGR|nr:translation initiation factor IF-2 [Drosophila grimshawi]EDV97943.1 GH14424 [Drosophila grimshawi]
MVKHIYMTMAALLILAIAVSAAPAKMDQQPVKDTDVQASSKVEEVPNTSANSDEDDEDDDGGEVGQNQKHDKKQETTEDVNSDKDDDDDDDDDDDSLIRRRRDAVEESAKEPAKAEAAPAEVVAVPAEVVAAPAEVVAAPAEAEAAPAAVEQSVESSTTIPTAASVTTTRKPVLVLIRDALKKVTAGLPTEQVANNALQYFQLFEHFIQQTIEQVIDAADDEEEDTPAAVPAASVVTEDDKKPETAEKLPEENSGSVSAPVPIPISMENIFKPAEAAVASNVV